ncbi:MAG: DUF2617 family protein [Planctomycetales bacterium]
MHVGFARPQVAELVFQLYGRSVHPELFGTRAAVRVQRDDFSASLRLCDEGHAIGFRFGSFTVTEVATTRLHALPRRKRLLERKLHGFRDVAHAFDCGIRYWTSYQVERLDPDVFLNVHEELSVDCGRATVAHRFGPGNRLAPAPLSLMRCEATGDSLLVHAFHTFPDECAVVRAQSLFEISG